MSAFQVRATTVPPCRAQRAPARPVRSLAKRPTGAREHGFGGGPAARSPRWRGRGRTRGGTFTRSRAAPASIAHASLVRRRYRRSGQSLRVSGSRRRSLRRSQPRRRSHAAFARTTFAKRLAGARAKSDRSLAGALERSRAAGQGLSDRLASNRFSEFETVQGHHRPIAVRSAHGGDIIRPLDEADLDTEGRAHAASGQAADAAGRPPPGNPGTPREFGTRAARLG